MKVRVYYGETNAYNYITFLRGRQYIIFYNYYNFIKISRENINKIVNDITFNDFDERRFIDLYNVMLSNLNGFTDAGGLSDRDLVRKAWSMEEIMTIR